MRRSHKTNTLVLISNHVESIHDDRKPVSQRIRAARQS
jgi:hypothetical protein